MVQLKKPKETAIPKDEHRVEYSELDHLKMATMKPDVPSPKEQFTQSQGEHIPLAAMHVSSQPSKNSSNSFK